MATWIEGSTYYEPCERCGWLRQVQPSRKTQKKICRSCSVKRLQRVGECIPWHGHYGTDMVTPVDEDGNEVKPGKRLCDNLDCVNPKHIERKEDGNGNN